MRYTIKATEVNGKSSMKTHIEGETEQIAIDNFFEEYSTHWDFGGKIDWIKPSKRFSYSIVGMGVFSLLETVYSAGRVEIFDSEDESGYSVDEASYFVPKSSMDDFYKFIDDLETDFPMNLSFGNIEQCQKAVSEQLGIPVDKLNDKETKQKYYRQKNKEYLESLDPEERARLNEKFGESETELVGD